ncbi:glutathione S-transferase family protein [Duganella violaceipulchra]|uniref:Glutathione S-transferase n=1 Tax=Duganella violaceipulchra TaxID=2849652 RepID=A0AA41HBD2_9BURK|nr:glutathione S-transferase family protein [Duganella violaceicalia]MBV6321514.1 glutathione S-transferase family protein [Duganella violaceicalia]MCP2008229.1 glutathione S-transferase [Duganella violaceicalia]
MLIKHIKLYHSPASRSTRIKWMLHEVVGNAFEVEKIDLSGAVQYSAEFLRLNPNHNVPVLEISWDNGATQRMLESAAMVAFLADAYPDAALAPAPAASPERADYLQMLHFGSTWVDMMLWQIRAHEHVLPVTERDPRTVARYRKKFREEIEPQLLARLERAPYICGQAFTAADYIVGHAVFWARGYGLCGDEIFQRYLALIAKRPAFGAAFADAREFVLDATDLPLSQRFTG